MNRKLQIVLCLLLASTAFGLPALAAGEASPDTYAEESVEEIAKDLANPNTPLASLTFKNQFRFYTGDLPHSNDEHSYALLFQPSFPMTIGRTQTPEGEVKNMLFFRPAFPLLIEQPVFDEGDGGFRHVTGMADIGFDLMLGRSYPSGLVVGAGLFTSIPTGKKELSLRTWTLGPEGVVASVNNWGVVAVRAIHEWNVGGSRNLPTSSTLIQPALVFLPGGGWSVGTAPEMAYGWQSDQWTIPLNLSISKTVKLGKTPVKFGLQFDYFVARPDLFAPEWGFSINVTPVVSNVFASWLGLI